MSCLKTGASGHFRFGYKTNVDVFTYAAIAIVVGPMIAGLCIPIVKWLFADSIRLMVFLLVVGGFYVYWFG